MSDVVHKKAASSDAAFFSLYPPRALAGAVRFTPPLLALALAAVLPAAVHTYHPTFIKRLIFQTGALIAAWAAFALTSDRASNPCARAAPRGRASDWLTAFVCLGLASCAWSRAPGISFFAAIDTLFWALWAAAVAAYVRRTGRADTVAVSVLLSSMLAAGAGLLLYWRPLPGDPSAADVLMLPLGNPNFMAGLQVAGAMLAAAWAARSGAGPASRAAGLLALGLAVVAFYLTRSDAGWIALAAGAAALVWLAASRPVKAVMLAVAAAGCAAIAAALSAPPNVLSDRIMAIAMNPQSTISGRLFDWMAATDMIRERPWFGRGAGGFLLAHPSFRPPAANLFSWASDRAFDIHPHNEWLDIAVETGLAGLFLYVSFLTTLLFAAYRRLRVASSEQRWALRGGVAAIIAFQAQAMFSVGLRYWDLAPFFWTLAGMLMPAEQAGKRAETPRAGRPRRPRTLLAAAGVAVLLWALVPLRSYRGQILELRGVRALKAGAPDLAAAHFLNALQCAGYYVDAVRVRLLLARAYEGFPNEEGLDDAIRCFRELDALCPNFGRAKFELGRLLLRRRRFEDALSFLSAYGRLNPYSTAGAAALCAAYESLGDAAARARRWEDAVRRYKQALLASRPRPRIAAKYADALLRLGRLAEAERWRRWIQRRAGSHVR